jgi:hypothetical protein
VSTKRRLKFVSFIKTIPELVKLSWDLRKSLSRQALRIISRYFSPQKMIKLSTALFTSRLYYEANIWLSRVLSATLKKKLWQTSSKYFFKMLHKISKKATPEM